MRHKTLAEEIHDMAISCGFDNCGIIPLSDLEGYQTRLQERLERVPQSAPFYQQVDNRPSFPWAKSLVICTIWLGKYRYPEALRGKYGKAFLLSPSSDRSGPAYREKQRFEHWFLQQGIRCEGGDKYGNNKIAPLRYAAMMAGLGIIRKNNFFYTEKGSWIELEGYLIDRECERKERCTLSPCADTCTLCQKHCPTKTLSAPYTMNPMKCLSFYNTFGGGRIPPTLDEATLGEWICGCDACQDACPYNHHDWEQGEDFPGLPELVDFLQPEQLLQASDAALQEKAYPKMVEHVSRKHPEIFRINAERVLRNRKS